MAIVRINLKNHSHCDVMHMHMEDFDLALSKILDSLDEEEPCKNLWMCNASKASVVINSIEWCKEVIINAYVPIPYPKEEFEVVEWMHCLTTLDICTMSHGIKLYDEEGYDIVPIQMIDIIEASK